MPYELKTRKLTLRLHRTRPRIQVTRPAEVDLPEASGLLETSPPVRTFRALGSTVPSTDSGKDKKQGVVSSTGTQKLPQCFSQSLLGSCWVGKRRRRQEEPGPSSASGDVQGGSVLCSGNSLTRRETTCLTPGRGAIVLPI